MVVRNVVRSPVRAVVQSVFGEGESFHPFQLFTSGAQGAWYDPSDFSTLYQDAIGTTPVTAVEQPVRLMLDRSRGLVLGSELRGTAAVVTAGTPAEAGTYNSATGEAYVYRTDGPNTAGITIPAVSGKVYRLQITIFTATAAIGVRPAIFSGTILASFPNLIGTHEVLVAATSSELVLMLATNSTGQSFTLESVRELPGNHAVAPNDASRPVLRSRYNLLTRSEEFDDAYWANQEITVTANATAAPDGTMTADRCVPTAVSSTHQLSRGSVISSQAVVISVFAKADGYNTFELRDHAVAANGATFNLSAGTVTNIGTGVGTITPLTNGWYRCVLAVTSTGVRFYIPNSASNFTGDGTSGIYIWGAQLLTAADHAATGGAYQRVGAATDYDTGPPWRPYLAFDGVDDFMTLGSAIPITTDMTVVRGFGRASAGIKSIGEGPTATNGYGVLWWTDNTRNTRMAGSTRSTAANTATGLFVGTATRSASAEKLRINGNEVINVAAGAATGAFNYFGRSAADYNNGPIYGLIVLDRELTGAELTQTEQWIAGKTGVSL